VAVKKIFRALLHSDAMMEFQAEANMLRHLRHPNIVLFMGTCIEEKDMSIVTEFMKKGSLKDVLTSTKLDWKMILKIAIDAATGMNYLHTYDPPIIHRDLKSMNLLVDGSFNVKVSDFGLARFTTSNKATTFCGTLQWTAPEILLGVGYTTKADVYSYGVVLWELFTRSDPHKNLSQAAIISGVAQQNIRPPIPADCPPAYAQLMRDCWESDPQKRPSFADILTRLEGMIELTRGTTWMAGGHSWEIDSSEIELSGALQQGTSSRVYRARFRGQDVAIKELFKNEGDLIDGFKKELEIMSTVRSPLFVYFYGATIRPSFSIVQELMHSSLLDLMNQEFVFTWRLVVRLALESVRAVNALHCWKPPVTHCNLKSTKILLTKTMSVRVSGLGLAQYKTNQSASKVKISSVQYAAPETFKGQGFTVKSDVYSLSIIMWELATRFFKGTYQQPYSEFPNIFQDVQTFMQAVSHQNYRPTIPSQTPPIFAHIIQKCWNPSPDARPTLNDVIPELEGMNNEFSKTK